MSLVNKLPTTNFTLPSGEVVETRNIFKTILIDTQTKNDLNLIKIKNGTTISKLENISYKFYGTKTPLYWLTIHLNNIDSFSNIPIPQRKFKINLKNKYPGMIYYSHGGKQIKFEESDLENVTDKTNTIKEGDVIVLFKEISENDPPDNDTWVSIGVVKEYDKVFRRIIVEKEILNPNNSKDDLKAVTVSVGPKLFIFRKNTENSWGQIAPNSNFMSGRQELEYQKTISIHDSKLSDPEISPFKFISTEDYDFSDIPSILTIIFSFSTNFEANTNQFYFDTLENSEQRSNIKNNTIKYMETPNAYEFTSFVETLLGTGIRRGQIVGFSL